MGFFRFVLECLSNALGYVVGDVYTSHEIYIKAIHGTISTLLFVMVSFLLIKFFCLDYEGYPKKNGCIVLAIILAVIIALIYLAIVYWFECRTT